MKIKSIFLFLIAFGFSFYVTAQSTAKNLPVAEYYTGGQEALLADIQKMIVYPPMAKRNRIQGECIVAITLEADGRINNQKLIKGVGGGCGDEAMRVVKNLKFNAPGYRLDTHVPVRFALPKPGK